MLICKSGSKFTSGRDMLVDRRVAGSVDLRQQIDDDGGPAVDEHVAAARELAARLAN